MLIFQDKLLLIFQRLRRSSFLVATSIYTFTSVLNALIPFILLPLLTNKLSPGEYGIIAMYQLLLNFLMPIASLSIENSIGVEYYSTQAKHDFNSYLSNSIIIIGLNFLILITITSCFSSVISKLTQIPLKWIFFCSINAFLSYYSNLLLGIYQVSKKPKGYAVFQISSSIVNFTLSLILVFGLNLGLQGRLTAIFITSFVFSIVGLIIIDFNFKLKFSLKKDVVFKILKFSVPLIPHSIGIWILSLIDRFFLTNMVNIETTGKYSVAFQLASIISFLTLSFNNAYVPWLFEKLNIGSSEIKLDIVKKTYIYFIILGLIVLLFIITIPIIIRLFISKEYEGLLIFFPFLVFGFYFQGCYLMITNYINYVRKTNYQALVTFLVALFKLPLTFILIKIFGAIGAAVAFCATYFLFFIFSFYVSNRFYRMPWNFFMIKNK
jgi:O-antigen/teichoic acid export membrane protein